MILFSERQQDPRLFKVGKKLDTIIAAYSVFNGDGGRGGVAFVYSSNLKKCLQAKFRTCEIPTRTSFGVAENPWQKVLDPRNTHKTTF